MLYLQGGPKKRGHRLMTIMLSNLNRFKKNTGRFLGKFAVKWILKIPPHLAYATYATFCGIFNIHLTANLLRNLPVEFFS